MRLVSEGVDALNDQTGFAWKSLPSETNPLRFIRIKLHFAPRDFRFPQFGVSPTKVRKVPQDSCQLPGRKGFSAIPELPNGTWFSRSVLGA